MIYRFNMRLRMIAALTLVIAMVGRADTSANDSPPPDTVFANRNLTVSGICLILPDESQVHDGVASVKQKAQTVHVETTSRRDLRFDIQKDRHDLEGLCDS